MFWGLIVLLGAAVLVLLAEPFFRTKRLADSLDEEDYLAAQVADIARDREAGLISEADADAAALEARRRLLAAHRAAEKDKPVQAGTAARQFSAMLVVAAAVGAFVLYVLLGNPGHKETPEAQRMAANMAAQTSANARSLSDSIATLEARLKDNPDILDDWVMLAESYANTDRFADAAQAFAKASALAPQEAYLHAAEGESIAMAAGGIVTAQARDAFDRALAIDNSEPRARFYLAIGAYQEGRREEALEALKAIEKDAPPGVGWLPVVRSQIEMISAELGKPVEPFAPAGNSATDLEAEISGGDAPYQSWIALINAYAASGDVEQARDAVARARTRYAGAPFVLQEIAAAEARFDRATPARRGPTGEQMQAAQSMSEEDRSAMIKGMVAGLAARLENEPDDLEGWTMLARSYGVLNEYENSAIAYARAIDLAPEDLTLQLGRAEVLLNALSASGKPIDKQAEEAFAAIARIDADHPFALYFQGLAASQRGDAAAARDYWTRLIEVMPAGGAEAVRIQALIDEIKDQ